VTVVDTFAQCHHKNSTIQAGITATEATKCQKYNDHNNYRFQPVTIETIGVFGNSTAPFSSGFARKLVDMSGDARESHRFHQLPICGQRECCQLIGLCANLV